MPSWKFQETKTKVNDEWFKQKFWRLTASKCLTACRIAKLVSEARPNAELRAYNFIFSNIWKIKNKSFQSTWMKYGLESEPKAVEIKSLKLLKQSTIEEVTSGKASLCSDLINRQCFSIKDGKCILKHKHDYYYQTQMQLLVTERHFCDFILYAEGPVSIERIYRNEDVIAEILSNLTTFWVRVVALEFFEMRVPRGLHPFILSEDDTSCDAPVNNCGHAPDELDIADVLVHSLVQVSSTGPTNPINNLVVIPLGWRNKHWHQIN